MTEIETNKKELQSVLHAEALAASIEYFKGDELAASVWLGKYALKDSNDVIYEMTPDDMHHRIAYEIARIEAKYSNAMSEDEIFDLIKDFKYIIPQGSPMSGIGNNFQIASLSNCFVIGNDGANDSYGGILKTDQEQIQLMKRRGGVGHDLSHIRPKGSPVENSALSSTGVATFMERYSNSTREVAQNGRRGALMLSMSVNHPDIESFVDIKMEQGKVTGANVSVKIDNMFMDAVKAGKEYMQKYPIYSEKPLIKNSIDATKLWNKIIHNAWKSAEPGVLFWDTIISESIPDCYSDFGYRTVSVNPCGELVLCPYDSCRLLAINLFSYVINPFTLQAYFDFDLFKKHVGFAQRMMDDIIDLELEKIDAILKKIASDPESDKIKRVERELWEEIRSKAVHGRRTGVGITAEGDMLAALGIRYGSHEGNDFAVSVHKALALAAYRSSVELAKERGAFPIFNADLEKNNPFIKRLAAEDPALLYDMQQYGRRNIALLTIAPTGTTSLMSQTTSGIEPVFMPVYKRRRKINANDKSTKVDFTDEVGDNWEEYIVFHHKFKQWMEVAGYDISKKYSNEEIEELVSKSPYHKATANDVDWVMKVKMQGAVQKWVDHSISVTINVPENTTEELISKLYMTAWEEGCKGVTVYRDGSRSGVLVSATEKKKDEVFPQKRPKQLKADVIRFQNNREKWIAFIGTLNGKPYEVFTGPADEALTGNGILLPKSVVEGFIIKNENDENSRYDFKYVDQKGYEVTIQGLSHKFDKEFWNYAKFISGALRHGMPTENVVELINSLQFDDDSINTWKNGVVRAFKKFIPDGTEAKGAKCENCKSTNVVYQEGCLSCKDCGSSKCG